MQLSPLSMSLASSSQYQLCSKEQFLHHVMNNCEVALLKRQYNVRHDKSSATGHLVWNASSVHMVELTIPFETGIENAASQKQLKYVEVESCRWNGFHATLTTFHVPGLTKLYKIVNGSSKARHEVEREVIRQAIEESFPI